MRGADEERRGAEARNLHEKKHECFKPTHKPIFQTNDLPQFTNVTNALLARINVIEFVFEYDTKTPWN